MKLTGKPSEAIREKEQLLKRSMNSMSLTHDGSAGCRLGICYPEITEMQARAIFEAAGELARKGKTVLPESWSR